MNKYKIKKGIITRSLQGKITLFNGEKSELITLNSTGSLIFNLIKKGYDKKTILDKLRLRFKNSNTNIESDLDAFVATLKEQQIII